MFHIEERRYEEEKVQVSLSKKVQHLSSAEISRILGCNEKITKLDAPHHECIPLSEYHTNTYAANSHNEDRHSELVHQNSTFFGVYDGHGGVAAANYSKEHIIRNCQINLAKSLSGHKHCSRDVQNALETAFLDTDREFLKIGYVDETKLADVYSGACAIVACTIGNHLFVANAGDCRAVLGRLSPNAANGEGDCWKAVQLSNDHTAESEEPRLRSEHPDEWDVVQNGRVKGNLEPSRCIGDALYKEGIFNMFLREDYRMPEPFHPPYITAKPEVITLKLTPEDSFLIIGSDGLWDRMSNEEAVEIVGNYLRNRPDENVATILLKKVLENSVRLPGGGPEEKISYALQLPQRVKRMFHDDTTITVVFFDANKIKSMADSELKLAPLSGTESCPKLRKISD